MQKKDRSGGCHDFIPGYRVARDGFGFCLVSPEGRRVARLVCEQGGLDGPPEEEWRDDFCQVLLLLALAYPAEREALRERVRELGERLEECQKERDTLERLSEDLYEFFSRAARRVAQRGEEFGR